MDTALVNILVIGGNGYIGSALSLYLGACGHLVDSVDLCLYGDNVTRSRVMDFCQMSAEDLGRYDVIILLAGNSSVHSCLGAPLHSLDNNVRNFVQLLGKIQDQKLLYASTSSVYGITPDYPASEQEFNFKPISNYDLTKMVIDHYASLSSARYYGLRFGTVSGYLNSAVVREDIMINAMVKSALTQGVITCMNPELHRPILGLRDLCRAVKAIVDAPEAPRGIYNLASFNSQVGAIAARVQHHTKANIKLEYDPRKVVYDFQIDTALFECTFDFQFKDTADDIILSLLENHGHIQFSPRLEPLAYVSPT